MKATTATRRRIREISAGIRALVVDDEWSVRELLEDFLGEHLPGAKVETASTAGSAREQLANTPFDLVLTDVGLPDVEGPELITEIVELYPNLTVIVITGGDHPAEFAGNLFRQGIYDFIAKPIDLDRLGLSIDRAIERLHLALENELLRHKTQLPGMIGDSPAMAELARQVRLIAPRDTCVLIQGESGTGKELVAKAIHELSHRATGPFVPVNVAAIPETLLEAEFFGYGKNSGVSGAPPGGRAGMFEAASGGTLFLDEIGDMPVGAQAKVLRALQEHEVVRIGTTQPVPIDIRVVCATHQDLEAAVAENTFREDLYFRLSGFPIHVPALRDRPEDIPDIAQMFLDEFSANEPAGSARKVFAPDAMRILQRMPWPGNVRELKSRVERLGIISSGDVIRASDLDETPRIHTPPPIARAAPPSVALSPQAEIQDFATATGEFERAYLVRVLEACSWNVTQAAERAKLSRTYIHRLMKKHGIERPS